MILGEAISKNGVKIRLTSERWAHITTSHPEIDKGEFSEVLDTIENPDFILEGDNSGLIAVTKRLDQNTILW